MPAVAEGVEKAEQVNFLGSVGCEYLQGFYFARPMPIDEYEKLVKENKEKIIQIEGYKATIDAEKGSLMLYDSQDNTLQVKVVYGLKDKKHEEDINNGIVEYLVRINNKI